jgi:hypothetical protein
MKDNLDKAKNLPVEKIEQFTPQQLSVLKSRWITTIDEFVAVTATDEGAKGICNALGIEQKTLEILLQEARNLVGNDRYIKLCESKPGGHLGLLLDDEQKGRFINERGDKGEKK